MSKPYSQEKKQEWIERIRNREESGLTIKEWCRQNQISSHCFYYWGSRLFPKKPLADRSSFTELCNAHESGLFIEYGGMRIYLDKYFDSELLKRCLFTLRELKC